MVFGLYVCVVTPEANDFDLSSYNRPLQNAYNQRSSLSNCWFLHAHLLPIEWPSLSSVDPLSLLMVTSLGIRTARTVARTKLRCNEARSLQVRRSVDQIIVGTDCVDSAMLWWGRLIIVGWYDCALKIVARIREFGTSHLSETKDLFLLRQGGCQKKFGKALNWVREIRETFRKSSENFEIG